VEAIPAVRDGGGAAAACCGDDGWNSLLSAPCRPALQKQHRDRRNYGQKPEAKLAESLLLVKYRIRSARHVDYRSAPMVYSSTEYWL
jgi:hypothetical protein